jgi:hypothetical protein
MMRILATIAVMLALATALNAQNRRRAPVVRANIQQTTDIINDCERRTNKFKKTLDRALARENVRAGDAREEHLNRTAKRLENQLDKVGDAWNRDHDIERTRDHVRAAVALSGDIDNAMRRWNMGRDAESEWAVLRSQLNHLANTFNLRRGR